MGGSGPTQKESERDISIEGLRVVRAARASVAEWAAGCSILRTRDRSELREREFDVGERRLRGVFAQRGAQRAGLTLFIFSFGQQSEVYGRGTRGRVQRNLPRLDPAVAERAQELRDARGAESRSQPREPPREVFELFALGGE